MKESSVNRVVGRFHPDDETQRAMKGRVLQAQKEKFLQQAFRDIEENTREKTPEEREVIRLIDATTNKALNEFGIPEFNTPEKMYNAIQLPTNNSNPAIYRVGLLVKSRDGTTRKLDWLNEAVVEELAIRHFPAVMKDPVFSKFVEQTRKLIKNNAFIVAWIYAASEDVFGTT